MQALIEVAGRLAGRPGQRTVALLPPPFCYGAWSGPRVDLSMLGTSVRAQQERGAIGVVLSDIPDDDASLVAALATEGVLGALAIGCGCLDVWVCDAVGAAAIDAGFTVRRTPESPLPRVVIEEPAQITELWALFEELAGAR